MAYIDITKMSSKEQVVIRNKDQIILKKADKFNKNIEEDLEFARRTEEAYKRIESGEGISMEFEDFIKEMKKW